MSTHLHACSAPHLYASTSPHLQRASRPPYLYPSMSARLQCASRAPALRMSTCLHLQRASRAAELLAPYLRVTTPTARLETPQLHSSTSAFLQRSSSAPYLHVCMTAARLQSSMHPQHLHHLEQTARTIHSIQYTEHGTYTTSRGDSASRRCHHLQTLLPLRTLLLPPDLAATTRPPPDLPARYRANPDLIYPTGNFGPP